VGQRDHRPQSFVLKMLKQEKVDEKI